SGQSIWPRERGRVRRALGLPQSARDGPVGQAGLRGEVGSGRAACTQAASRCRTASYHGHGQRIHSSHGAKAAMKSIVLFNNKGGVGKTTLTFNIAHMMAREGWRVAVLDYDPQCNLSAIFL